MSNKVKLVVTLSKGQYENLKDIQFGGIGSRMIYNAVKNGTPLSEKKGKWIKDKENKYHCSRCGRTVKKDWVEDMEIDYPFCHCGADMREVVEE